MSNVTWFLFLVLLILSFLERLSGDTVGSIWHLLVALALRAVGQDYAASREGRK